ncbi:MAG: carbohydrate-binding family 9-like protein [Ignavibacteria bacterium]|nr:carbohydrate-binding family 9-like protein [Ignavibacteria bacterium]
MRRSRRRRAWTCSRRATSAGTPRKTPEIDGKLSDAAWAKAPWTDDFVDIEGDAKPAPRFRTRAKLLWDERCLYIAAELEEPHVWGTLLQRDTVIFYDNDFEVFLDPNGDTHEYFEFEMNALNTVWDLSLPLPYKDGGKAIDSWDIEGLRTGGQGERDHQQRATTTTAGRSKSRCRGPRSAGPRGPPVRRTTATAGGSTSRASMDHRHRRAPATSSARACRRTTGCGRRSGWWTCIVLNSGAFSSSRRKAAPTRRPDTWTGPRKWRCWTSITRSACTARRRSGPRKLAELARFAPKGRPLRKSIEIVATREGYTATLRGDGSKHWKIKQDSRLWAE